MNFLEYQDEVSEEKRHWIPFAKFNYLFFNANEQKSAGFVFGGCHSSSNKKAWLNIVLVK